MAVLMESALLFLIKCLVHSHGQEAGLSMVLEDDQILHPYSYTVTIGNWSLTSNPGLYSNLFNKNDNSKFHIPRSGVYYVTANLILETKNRLSYYYSWWRRYRRSITLHGEIYLRSSNGDYIRYKKRISTYVTMKQYQEKNLHISGYIQLEQGWELSIRLYDGYRWKKTVKAGSTLSISYASSSHLFPGVLLASNYEYIYLRSPQYSSFVNEWSEIDEGSSFNSTEGNIMVFHDGLYHILVNLNVRRYISDETLKFGVILNNKTTVIEKQVKVDVSGYVTVILEEILLLNERDVVSITVSSPNKRNENVRVQSSSKFFIFSKGEFLTSIPALSVQYKSNDKTEAANTYITLNNWDTSFSQNGIRHFKNVELKKGNLWRRRLEFINIFFSYT
ncbi:uncharacterized protein LOC124447723 [Xenia sp. Carnegie-2017]|uniref:uncharacterized protein LOC124447723 n=1 Tax=Xenia sp. Carnegie-2017 TaxID=2897299 RepID=UPI001F03A22C|nr:uncharacterized protein LOC124447723 [Xenia sp. Carnegie-2017]